MLIVALSLSSFGFNFLFHVLAAHTYLRSHPEVSRQKFVLMLNLLVASGLALLGALTELDSQRSFLSSLFLFITAMGFGHLYFHVFNLSETGRRVRILTDLLNASQPLAHRNQYAPNDMIENRVNRLVQMGALKQSELGFNTEPNILLFAAFFFRCCRRVFYGSDPSDHSKA